MKKCQYLLIALVPLLLLIFPSIGHAQSTVDLTPTTLTLSDTTVQAGDSVNVTWFITKTGTLAANNFYHGIYWSTDSTINGSDTKLKENGPSTIIAAGTGLGATNAVTIPAGASPGTYYIGYWADSTAVVLESNESNNTRAVAVTIGPVAPPGTFILIDPPNNLTFNQQSTGYYSQWGASEGATSYDVYLGTTSPPALYASDVTALGHTLMTPEFKIYYWNVVAKNAGGSTPASNGPFTYYHCYFKTDFNWAPNSSDNNEDILWRYYGAGGWNRAWFLGSTGTLSQPSGLESAELASPSDSETKTVQEGTRSKEARSSRVVYRYPRDAGVVLNQKRPAKDPTEAWNHTDSTKTEQMLPEQGQIREVDFFKMGLVGSHPGIADPRHASSAFDSLSQSDKVKIQAVTPVLFGGADLPSVSDLNWQIVGTGYFDGDLNTDILWRYKGAGGSNVVWFMDGANLISSTELLPVSDANWQIVGTGYFNGPFYEDYYTDILWRYNGPGGYVRVWYMNGTDVIGGADLLSVPDLNWKIVGTGDFNQDGHVDILWRYNGSGGYNVVWYMNGATWIGSAQLLSVADTNWQIVGTGDYNRDSKVDILWRYNGAGGATYIWYMDGVNWAGGAEVLSVPDLNWKIVSR